METLSITPPVTPTLLTIAEVADLLRCTRRTVERLIARRELHTLKIGRAVRIELVELERFLSVRRDDGG